MIPAAVLCDFDGTIVPEDVSEELLSLRGSPEWWEIDLAFRRGEIGSRECAQRQIALLAGTPDDLVALAVERFRVDPAFPELLRWCRGKNVEVSVVSDGFGFYIETMLAAAGVAGVPVITNRAVFGAAAPHLQFPNAHPACVGCGTCKMRAVAQARARTGGPVAFVGEGHTDRYGALYADLVFATKHLAGICDQMGIAYRRWETFADVLGALEAAAGNVKPRLQAGDPCPGWQPPEAATPAPSDAPGKL